MTRLAYIIFLRSILEEGKCLSPPGKAEAALTTVDHRQDIVWRGFTRLLTTAGPISTATSKVAFGKYVEKEAIAMASSRRSHSYGHRSLSGLLAEYWSSICKAHAGLKVKGW